jgi:5-methylcytosine-specific restriction enzyme subunit McrC
MVKLHIHSEHDDQIIEDADLLSTKRICFKDKRGEESTCFEIYDDKGHKRLRLSYYIGLDWINETNAIYVQPKVNAANTKADYLAMLCSSLKHSDVVGETENLYQINFEQPHIEIEQKKDLLTPLLIVHFLQVTRIIVKKGLKKGYYPVEENLNARLKGKVLTAKNIRSNIFKNQPLKTLCSYNEFGYNTLENRLIKKTLKFIQRYSAQQPSLRNNVAELLKFCLAPFDFVNENVELNTIKATHVNPLFKEYRVAVKLAKLILKRFGYNINTIDNNKTVSMPPFWIDMSRLFELYVLGKLKDRFRDGVKYQFTKRWNELDYLVNTADYKMIVDAKYKLKYGHTYIIDDIRQISGYARLSAVSQELGKEEDEIIDCLIVYPDQDAGDELGESMLAERINGFNRFYKMPIKLPQKNEKEERSFY